MATPPLSRAVTNAALQAVTNSAWIAAGGLPPAKRRLARLGTVAAGAAAYSALPDVRHSLRELRSDISSIRDEAKAPADTDSPPNQANSPGGDDSPHNRAEFPGDDSPHNRAEPAGDDSPHKRAEPAGDDSPHKRAEPAGDDSPHKRAKTLADDSPHSRVETSAVTDSSPDRTATATNAAPPSHATETPADRPAPELSPADKRRLAAVGATVVFTMAIAYGRRRLQKRWLAGLARDGHAHPHRALALRVAPVAFAVELAVQVTEMYAIPRKPD